MEEKIFDKISGIGVASGFKLHAKAPLDPRLVVDTIADRDALVEENGAYEGMSVYVKARKANYQLIDGVWIKDDKTGGVSSVDHTHDVLTSGTVEESTLTPSGSVNISVGNGAANYTPAGTVSAPTITVTPATSDVNAVANVGSLPTLTHTYADGRVTLTFGAGTLPTTSSTTVVTGITKATSSAPTFTGSPVNLAAEFTGTAQTHSHNFTGETVTSTSSKIDEV